MNKRKIENIIFANDAEAFESIIDNIDNQKKRLSKIRKEHFLSSRFLFWEGDNKIVITPFPIEDELMEKAKTIGYKNIENWYPKDINISLSKSVVHDHKLFSDLVGVITENPGVTISPYCFTKDFSSLIKKLRSKSLNFKVDQEPKNNGQRLVDYLGSKVGFRIETLKISDKEFVPVPEFFICKNTQEIIDAVSWFYKKGKSSVIKANSGEGGWGVLMAKSGKYKSILELKRNIKNNLSKDSIWEKGPYVVEEFIPSIGSDQSSPSLEVFISDIDYEITYSCNQIINQEGAFLGILMGRGCINRSLDLKIKNIGKVIAKRYSSLGYKGFFDIDFIVSKNKIPYPIETNVRRTGGTHVFDLAKHIYGNNWYRNIAVISTDSFTYGGKILTAKNILEKMTPLLFPIKAKKEGVILVASDAYHPVFSFVIFSKTKKGAQRLYSKLTHIWS